jgi:hypothetical protein
VAAREPKLIFSTLLELQQARTSCPPNATGPVACCRHFFPPRVSSLAGEPRLWLCVGCELTSLSPHRYKEVARSKPSRYSSAYTHLKAAPTSCRPSSSRSRRNSRPRSITRSRRGRRFGLASLTASVYFCHAFSSGSRSELSDLHASSRFARPGSARGRFRTPC